MLKHIHRDMITPSCIYIFIYYAYLHTYSHFDAYAVLCLSMCSQRQTAAYIMNLDIDDCDANIVGFFFNGFSTFIDYLIPNPSL